jgi:glycosyltransferase involved in cell wall biosynthesis
MFAFHNNYLSDELYRNRAWIYRPFNMLRLRLLMHFINNFHVINGEDYAKVTRLKPGAKVYLIPNFIPGAGVGGIGLNRREFMALFVGRLATYHKGLDLLAEIINRVESSGDTSDMAFHIIGSGKDGEGIVEKLEGTYKNVKWLGFVSDKKLVEEYGAASMLLLPSRYEGFSVSLIEAQSHGLPAVAFNVRGPRDMLKSREQGVLIETFNTEDFARAVRRYYDLWRKDKSGYHRIKRRIASRVDREYGSGTIVPKLLRMFSDVGG